MIGRFLKALALLGLWLLVVALIIRFLLPSLLGGLRLEDEKETIALIGTLLTALIGFGIQQWKGLEEEEQRRRQRREEALTAIEDFASLVRNNPSEGARQYIDLKNRGGIWQSGQVRAALEETWEKSAPKELRTVVTVIESPGAKDKKEPEVKDALLWAYRNLDEDWRCRVAEVLYQKGLGTPQQERLWLSSLKLDPSAATGYADWDRVRGLFVLGLDRHPFGLEKSEADPLFLLEVRTFPSWWNKVDSVESGLFVAESGGGRTATALLLTYDFLQSKAAFPVYWRFHQTEATVLSLACIVAQALVDYIAIRPSSFTNSAHSARTAITRLLIGCLEDPLRAFRRAGLPTAGEGEKVLREIKSCLSDPYFPLTLTLSDYLSLLSDARPDDFPCTVVLLDAQETPREDTLWDLWNPGEVLARAGIFLKIFLPASPETERLGEQLSWSDEDLKELLTRRFALIKPGENVEALCDLKEWGEQSAEALLIAAARRNPAMLIRLGNQLLSRIGQTGRRLTPSDVQKVLRRKQ